MEKGNCCGALLIIGSIPPQGNEAKMIVALRGQGERAQEKRMLEEVGARPDGLILGFGSLLGKGIGMHWSNTPVDANRKVKISQSLLQNIFPFFFFKNPYRINP